MPVERIKIKPVKTDYKSKELNPFYAKEFEMYVYISVATHVCGGYVQST